MPQPLIRALYSFPFRIGSGQICLTAWEQVVGLSGAGVTVTAAVGSVARPLPSEIEVVRTLGWGRFRVPFRLLGRMRMCQLHDLRVAKLLLRLKGKVDVVHAWPLASLATIRVARQLGIPVVLERPNAHTRYAFEVVGRECCKLGYRLPRSHEHAFDSGVLEREEAEYEKANYLLCPSDFVADTFRLCGFADDRILRHHYGFDPGRFGTGASTDNEKNRFTMIYGGGCAPRKGLHYALKAWLDSGAAEGGRFLVCGEFVEGYRELLTPVIDHPSVEVLGHRRDLDRLMREAHVFVLPSIEEGSALVTYEARASGCVLLVSDASGAPCTHQKDSLVHRTGDVEELTRHIRLLSQDRQLLKNLRRNSLDGIGSYTWANAGRRLADLYKTVVSNNQCSSARVAG
jgi:glycosyltransferase involved in cell wall biosynthesis